MTPKQKAALEYWNLEAGIKQGSALAQAIVEQFPDGFSDAQCDDLAANIKQSLSEALDVIPKRFRESFHAGYYAGCERHQYQGWGSGL